MISTYERNAYLAIVWLILVAPQGPCQPAIKGRHSPSVPFEATWVPSRSATTHLSWLVMRAFPCAPGRQTQSLSRKSNAAQLKARSGHIPSREEVTLAKASAVHHGAQLDAIAKAIPRPRAEFNAAPHITSLCSSCVSITFLAVSRRPVVPVQPANLYICHLRPISH
jgi:hypothetical protein